MPANAPTQRKLDRALAEIDVVVFDLGRPVRSETVFDAGADRAAPTGLFCTIDNGAAVQSGIVTVLDVADRRAAADEEQRGTGRITHTALDVAEAAKLRVMV